VRFVRFAAAAALMTLTRCVASGTPKVQVATPPVPTNAHQVVIFDYKFAPQALTVPVGTTVTWVNHDLAPHTATHRSFGDAAFDSGSLVNNQAFSREFGTAGTYAYLCIFHQGMTGTIVVQ